MIDKEKTYAVIGVSSNPEKYGYKVFQDLKNAGYDVFAVNLKGGKVLDSKVYPTLLEIPKKIDIAIFVVPPSVTEEILMTVKKLKINKVWLQPGSESQKAINFCRRNNIECIYNACIIIKRNNPS